MGLSDLNRKSHPVPSGHKWGDFGGKTIHGKERDATTWTWMIVVVLG
jgi:hypothetical protein